jgi:hypothetical protein
MGFGGSRKFPLRILEDRNIGVRICRREPHVGGVVKPALAVKRVVE